VQNISQINITMKECAFADLLKLLTERKT